MGRGQRGKCLHCLHRKVIVCVFVASVFFVFLQGVVTGFAGLARRENCFCVASFVFGVLNGYEFSTGRRWYWYFIAYTFKDTQNVEKTPGFVEAEGDGIVAPRPLFLSTLVDTASDDGVRPDS